MHTDELVAISIEGKGAAWCDGIYTGDPEIVAHAKRAEDIGVEVPIGLNTYLAHPHDALGALAAIMSYKPGRAFIVQAPEDVRLVIESGLEPSPVDTQDNINV